MRVSTHGGHCCGITHVYDFYHFSEGADRRLRQIAENRRNRGGMLEMVLIDDELNLNDWGWSPKGEKEGKDRLKKAMIDLGFEFKTRFFNGNSANYCNVYHMSRNPQRSKKNPPSLEIDNA